MKDLTPRIIAQSQEIIEKQLNGRNNKNIFNIYDKRKIDNEINNFINKNRTYMNDTLIERESECYKHISNVSLLDLYTECMEIEAVYIPRKWRNDQYHVMSEGELNVLTNLELKRFQTECEILRMRRDDFKQRINHIDKEVTEYIKKENISTEAQDWLLKRWDECINEDERRIYQRWVEKIKGTRTQFEKDKEFITQHRIKRIKNPRERIRNNISTQNKNTNSNEAIPDIRDSRTSSSRCEDQSKKHEHFNTQVQPKILNISKRPLNKDEISVLLKGPKFCPTTGGNYINIKADIKDFTRKLKLKEKFNGQTFEDDSLVKKKSIYTPQTKKKSIYTPQTNNPEFQNRNLSTHLKQITPSFKTEIYLHTSNKKEIYLHTSNKKEIYLHTSNKKEIYLHTSNKKEIYLHTSNK